MYATPWADRLIPPIPLTRRELAFYPQTKSKQQTEGWRQHARGAPVQTGSVESFHEVRRSCSIPLLSTFDHVFIYVARAAVWVLLKDVSTPVRAGACLSVHARRVPRVLFYAGSADLHCVVACTTLNGFTFVRQEWWQGTPGKMPRHRFN